MELCPIAGKIGGGGVFIPPLRLPLLVQKPTQSQKYFSIRLHIQHSSKLIVSSIDHPSHYIYLATTVPRWTQWKEMWIGGACEMNGEENKPHPKQCFCRAFGNKQRRRAVRRR